MSHRSLHSPSRVVSIGLALFAFFAADQASAYCRMSTKGGAQIGQAACVERGELLEWRKPCLSYAIDGRGSQWMENDEIEVAVNAAFETWSTAECPDGGTPNLVFEPSMVPSMCNRAEFNNTGNVNTIAFLEDWKDPCAEEDAVPYSDLAFAVTIVWFDEISGEILDADLMVNDQQFIPGSRAGGPYADCPESGCLGDDADLRGIITHEAGHFIGIGHCNPIDDEDPNDPCVVATMFAKAERNAVGKRTLAPDDINAVCDIYPRDNPDESCDATPVGGLLLKCETTAAGNPIACDAPGSTSSSGGCSSSSAQTPAETLWATIAALLGLTVMRRRSGRRGARS
jgi:MYXO-CTERM domain-containing protein